MENDKVWFEIFLQCKLITVIQSILPSSISIHMPKQRQRDWPIRDREKQEITSKTKTKTKKHLLDLREWRESGWCVFSTCRASVPGCCSSFTVRPPAVFHPRPSCQVRFPPVRRLSWCLKSSGRALYSTAGLQKLKLDAAADIEEQCPIITGEPVTTANSMIHAPHKAPHSAWLVDKRRVSTHLDTLSFRHDLISLQNTCSHMLCWFWESYIR